MSSEPWVLMSVADLEDDELDAAFDSFIAALRGDEQPQDPAEAPEPPEDPTEAP